MSNSRIRELNEKLAARQAHIDAACAAMDAIKAAKAAGNSDEATTKTNLYTAELNAAKGMNAEIDALKSLISEEQRYADEEFAKGAGDHGSEKSSERGNALLKGGIATYTAEELRRALKSTVVTSATLAKPTEVGGIHGGFNNVISSLIDQVHVIDLTGCDGISEAFEVSDMEAQANTVASKAGQARTASDPTFSYAKIKPYEMTVTSFVDRNLKRLTPLAYEERIFGMAMRAMRRKANALITNGDGQNSPDMFGLKNATDYAGTAIYKTLEATSITADLLTDIVFSYGGDEEMGGNARLYLSKADLQAIGKLRGTNEKKRLFEIIPDAGNPNTGVIRDGGLVIPYTINSNCTSLSATTQGAAAVQTMVYCDPANYELALFGSMDVRIDESVKSIERMNTILGDAFIGGNLIVKNGAVVVTVPAAD